jgi:hypothetical protein
MIAYLPLFVCIVGLLIWALASNPKISEAGKIAYGCGLLAFLFQVAGHSVSFLR